MPGAAGRFGRGQHPGEARRLRVVHGVGHRVRRHAVPPESALGHARLEEAESLGQASIELVSRRVERSAASMGGVGQEVLGVVEKTDVEGPEAQPVKRPGQLVLEERGVHAVPAIRLVVHHLGKRAAGSLALLGQRHVLPLNVADLRDDDDPLARDPSSADRLADDLADQALAAPVGVVRGGVDEVHAARERLLEGAPVDRRPVVDAVAAESQPACRETGAPEGPVGPSAPRGVALRERPGPVRSRGSGRDGSRR